MEFRSYQQEAVDSPFDYWQNKKGDNPVIVAPTASGKSFIIAGIINKCLEIQQDVRILCLAHVKELIEQNSEELLKLIPDIDVGVFSAGMKRREFDQNITYAGIQSVHEKHDLFGHIDIVIIDEAHLVNSKAAGRYREFLNALRIFNPKLKTIGLTATPFRLGSGYIYGDDTLFDGVSYEISITELLDKEYICPLIPRSSEIHADLSNVRKRAGDFIAKDMQAAFDKDTLTADAVQDILFQAQNRRSILVFAASLSHAERIKNYFNINGEESVAVVTGSTKKAEREGLVDRIKSGDLRVLVNVGVYTTGFNAPNIDCVVLLRATESTSLYVQMVGRGMRIHDSKKDCLVLDYGENVLRHGPINDLFVKETAEVDRETAEMPKAKMCLNCYNLVSIQSKVCEHCMYEFPVMRVTHETKASELQLIDPMAHPRGTDAWFTVDDMWWDKHFKFGKQPSMRVVYVCGKKEYCEWICLDNPEGCYGKLKAQQWVSKRGMPHITTVDQALETTWTRPNLILVHRQDNSFFTVKEVVFDEQD